MTQPTLKSVQDELAIFGPLVLGVVADAEAQVALAEAQVALAVAAKEAAEATDAGALLTRVNTIDAISSVTSIYVSPDGDDADAGTISEPVASWEGVLSRLASSRTFNIFIDGDLDIDYYQGLDNPPGFMYFRQWSGESTARVVCKDHTNWVGGCGIWATGHCSFRFGVPVHLDVQNSTFGLINTALVNESTAAYFGGGAFTQSGTNTSNLIFRASGGFNRTQFAASPITAIAGKVFNGIASGVDPNTDANIITNITAG